VVLAATIPLAWRRRGLRWPPATAAIAGGAAIAVNLLTRTGAPLCRPESLLQGHAAWHALTALAIALWLAPPGGRRTDAEVGERRTQPHDPPAPLVRSRS
jgi:hypothetical protein